MKKATINTCIEEATELMKKETLTGADYGKIAILLNCFCHISQLMKNNPIKVKGIADIKDIKQHGLCFDFLADNIIQAPNIQEAVINGTLKPDDLDDFIPLLNVANCLYNMTSQLEHHLTKLNDNSNRLFTLLRTLYRTENAILKLKESKATKEEQQAIIEELGSFTPQSLVDNAEQKQNIARQIDNLQYSFAFVQAYNKFVELLAEQTGVEAIKVYLLVENTVKENTITAINGYAELLFLNINEAVEYLREEQSTLDAFNECITPEPLKVRKVLARADLENARQYMQQNISQPDNTEYLNTVFYMLHKSYLKKTQKGA